MQPPKAVTLGILSLCPQHDAGERVPAQAPVQLIVHIVKENGWLRGWLFIFPKDIANSGGHVAHALRMGTLSPRHPLEARLVTRSTPARRATRNSLDTRATRDSSLARRDSTERIRLLLVGVARVPRPCTLNQNV